ncbi:acyl-CoA dehydrogenase family protein [Candidatus Amarobacter glycogenicus]|uniref:acyl-CoA dehydrogenase family protein n=1 Tax=Candidatus Amarobacter glycogenicus TaxID=3140699 RepID=UPI0031CCD2C8
MGFQKKPGEGLAGVAWPKEHGGGQGRATCASRLQRGEMAYKPRPGPATWASPGFGPSLMLYGTDEQKTKFIPGSRAPMTGGVSIRPGAGSDLAAHSDPGDARW